MSKVQSPKSKVQSQRSKGQRLKAKAQSPKAKSQGLVKLPEGIGESLGRILRPQAAYRWLLPQLAAITPQYIEMTLRGALAGNHIQAWELFDLMLDTWPELASCSQELTLAVQGKQLTVEPYREEDEDPDPEAVKRCKAVSAALRKMRPVAALDENALAGTVADLLSGWFLGQVVLEVEWTDKVTGAMNMIPCGDLGQIVAPRATFWVHPVCYAWDMGGQLGLRLEVQSPKATGRSPMSSGATLSPGVWQSTAFQPRPTDVQPFPEHKFLVGIHKAKAGTALGGPMLRVLAWWWCAANFSADWLLNLAQLFGLPFRWANYDPNAPQGTIDSICAMLENMGSAGWAAFPAGTTLDLKDTGKTGDHSPQGELLDRADRYARLVILGQTMSGGAGTTGKGGGQAFGKVESEVKGQRITAAGKFACESLQPMVSSILKLNFGDDDLAPTIRLIDDSEGSLEEAQRDTTLSAGGLKIPTSFLYKKYNIPKPQKDEETIGGAETPGSDGAGDLTEQKLALQDRALDTQGESLTLSKQRLEQQGIKQAVDLVKGKEVQSPKSEVRSPKSEAQGPAEQKEIEDSGMAHYATALAQDMQVVAEECQALLKISDDRVFMQRAVALGDKIEGLKKDILALPKSAQALAEVQIAALFNGLTEKTTAKNTKDTK